MYPTKLFTFFSDPGHAWLKVSLEDVKTVGLTHDSFSQYSFYQNLPKGPFLYLEEDQDAGVFVKAFEEKYGHKPNFREKYSNNSSTIRSYNRLKG